MVSVERAAKYSDPRSTDEEGEAEIQGLEPETYMVVVHHPGYRSRYVWGIRLQPGDVAALDIELEPGSDEAVIGYSELTDFQLDWYSKHLRAMNEPLLCEGQSEARGESFRFLWLRSFDNPVLVQVEVHKDASGSVRAKITNGNGGYEPGEIVTDEKRELSTEEVDYLHTILKEADFWNMPTRINRTGMVGVDGSRWITEGRKGGQCHVVDRWSPDEPDEKYYKALGLTFLIDLAKLKLLYREVY